MVRGSVWSLLLRRGSWVGAGRGLGWLAVAGTRRWRDGCSVDGDRGQAELDLGAVRASSDPGRAAVALHAPDDRLAHAGAVVGRPSPRSKPGAVVADERLDAVAARPRRTC